MSEWIETLIGEKVKLSQGLAINAKTKHLLVEKSNLPLLRITDLINGTSEQFIDEENVPAKVVTDGSEIIFTRTGQVGLVFIGRKGVVHNNCFKVLPNKEIDINFLYWYLKQTKVELYLNNVASGSVQKDLNHDAFNSLEIYFPKSITEQKEIARTLSNLDKKITLLRQQNQDLEELAQTLFKRWFVEFEFPNENGEPYKSSSGKMVESELGEIPEGWKVTQLKEIVDFVVDNRGKTPPIIEKSSSAFPLVEVNSMNDNTRNIQLDQIKKWVDMETYNKWFRKGHPIKNDVLVSTVGSVGEIVLTSDERISIAQNVIALRMKNKGVFLFELLKSIKREIKSLDISSVQPSIKVPHLLAVEVIAPKNEVVKSFVETVNPISNRIQKNQEEIQTLTQLRDTLLPKLMSGELRVNN